MKIIVLGCGNIGSVSARDLARSLSSAEITLADKDEQRAKALAAKINSKNVFSIKADASNQTKLVATLEKFDLTLGALPGNSGYSVCKACINAGTDLVDVSYMPEDIMTLQKATSKAGITIIPDCGMSPGLSNILIGHAASQLDKVETVQLLNAGLPEKPIPPMEYIITWSVHDLIDMYSRKVHIIKENRTIQVEPMTGLEEVDFPGVGKLEAFYTHGLRTLLHTMKGVKEMWEKTLRYPGHIEKITLLKDLGFFDEKAIEVGEISVSPRNVTAELLQKKLKRKDVADIVVMKVDVSGQKDGKKVTYTYHLADRYDSEQHITAMARTTAYTASIVAQLLASSNIKEKGIIPPERLGSNRQAYESFMKMMRERKIMIKENIATQS